MARIPTDLTRSQAAYVRLAVETFLKAHEFRPPTMIQLEEFQYALRRPGLRWSLPIMETELAIVMVKSDDEMEWNISIMLLNLYVQEELTRSLTVFIVSMLEQHDEQFAEGLVDAWEYVDRLTWIAVFDQRRIRRIQTDHNEGEPALNGAHRAGRNAAYVKLIHYCHSAEYDHPEIRRIFFRIVMAYAVSLKPHAGLSEQ